MNYGIGFASKVRFGCYSMEAINLAQVFKENYDVSEEELQLLIEMETMERPLGYDDVPTKLFKGIILGGFFSLLLWAIIFWIII